jgi:hypothetical protein
MEIKIEKLSENEIQKRGIRNWPLWEKEASCFDWYYDQTEECLLINGKVEVATKGGKVEFGAGDFVTFPRGLSCVWNIKESVKKHFRFC